MFVCHRKDNTTKAWQYLCGLIQADKRNIERMEEQVAGTEYFQLQHFVSDSPWDSRPVFDKIAQDADQLLGGYSTSCLLLDECGFTKKGDASAGVARQYNGRLGKVDNCQVAVFGALCCGDQSTLIDTELYLPDCWTSDSDRCAKVGIPASEREYHTKPELAWRIVERQRKAGIRFSYVCADGLYGDNFEFCRRLDDSGEKFLVHVHSDQRVFLDEPQIAVPSASGRGRKPRKPQPDTAVIRVDELVKQLSAKAWKRLAIRNTTTGKLWVDAWCRQVWVWNENEKQARRRLLYVRRELDGELKYCLSNLPEDTSLAQLALMESQRFWIERSFENGKSEVGMADYQVRTWRGWHHHMALVMLAMLFMMKQRIIYRDDAPLLSCRDIREMLEYFLPKKSVSEREVMARIKTRHRRRAKAYESKAKRQAEMMAVKRE
jgi:SRSO17 transposase